ncbi:MAG: hypothetical protein POELPBGB_01940 [Bacteroidia bacterium]|nr:hypothetical protein [Bacteroidia bacterium]
MKILYATIALLLTVFSSFAQSTFQQVHSLLQANCTVGCHSGGSPSGQLNLSGTETDVWNELVNTNPVNPEANSKGMKLVAPGYPEKSFLFVKLSHDIDPVTHLTLPMGNAMPDGLPHLDYEEIELVRQWILFGAGPTESYLNTQILSDYYNGPGLPRIQAPAAPSVSEGFQIHYGPFFLNPSSEAEYFYKYETKLSEAQEIYRLNTTINESSHHTALYKYNDGLDTFFLPGLRPVGSILDAAGVYYASNIIAQWPNSQDLVLPEGTAFSWEANSVLDLNYHIANYSTDSILPAEFYINVYTQPVGTAQAEMISTPIYYGGADPLNLHIYPNLPDSIYRIEQYYPDTNLTWYIWSMMAHTHKLGTGYDVWMRTANGDKGDHIYNGLYNVDYTFNQGYYDWAHPPFRTFEPLLEVDLTEGLIHEATFNNPGPDTVGFGLSTADEMYVTYIQHTLEPVTIGVKEENSPFSYFNVYPNPSRDVVNLSFNSEQATEGILRLTDNLGREVYTQTVSVTQGKQKLQLSQQSLGLTSGFYSLNLATPLGVYTTKLVFQ